MSRWKRDIRRAFAETGQRVIVYDHPRLRWHASDQHRRRHGTHLLACYETDDTPVAVQTTNDNE